MRHRHIPQIAIILAALFSVAADKAKEPPSPAQIQQWVKQLGDDDFKVREEATQNLIKAGGAAFDAVTRATKSEDLEVKQRALMIIKQIRKQLEKAAVPYFKKLGGKVTVDQNSPDKPAVELILSYNSQVTDADLVHMKGLADLQGLYLQGTQVTDAGMVHLKGLSKLQDLNLTFIQVTDAGLVHLKGLAKLQELSLGNTKVTDAGLMHLKVLTKLKMLILRKTKVTKTGIDKLQKALPNCKIDWDGK